MSGPGCAGDSTSEICKDGVVGLPQLSVWGLDMNGHEHEGDVTIKEGGCHPEMGFSYEYIGNKHHFWFYCTIVHDGAIGRVTITDATPRMFEGFTLKFDPHDLAAITDNIQ